MKNGFTLVELLAVLTVMAVITLIVVPSVNSIIDEAKTDTKRISAKNYIDAVEKNILSKETIGVDISNNTYNIMEKGSICIGDFNNNSCDGEVIGIKVDGKSPSSGVIKIKDKKVVRAKNLKFSNFYANMDSDKNITISKKQVADENATCVAVTNSSASKTSSSTLIGSIPNGAFNIGDEYICDVGNNNKYHFYVLSVYNDDVNLILDRTINSDGGLTTSSTDSCTPYLKTSDGSDITYGPITAFKYIYEATSKWSNIPNISIDYEYSNATNSGVMSEGDITKIVKDGHGIFSISNLKVRLPYESEITSAGCSNTANSCPLWLSNYMASSASVTGGSNISSIYGYWIIPNSLALPNVVDYTGKLTSSSNYGGIVSTKLSVRPVITLSKLDFE